MTGLPLGFHITPRAHPERRLVMNPRPIDAEDKKHSLQEQSFARLLTIFSVSSGMVGVCITTIGLILVVEKLSTYRTLCDFLLVVDSILFLSAAIFSWVSMRLHFRRP